MPTPKRWWHRKATCLVLSFPVGASQPDSQRAWGLTPTYNTWHARHAAGMGFLHFFVFFFFPGVLSPSHASQAFHHRVTARFISYFEKGPAWPAQVLHFRPSNPGLPSSRGD